MSVWRMRSVPWPASTSSASMVMPRTRLSPLEASGLAQHFRIGQHEVRRRQRVGDLAHIELGLVAGVRIEPLGILHQVVRPVAS